MKFSFILPVFQGYFSVGRCLDSIAAQTDKSYEIIVINDGYDERMHELVHTGSPNARYFENKYVGRKGGFAGIPIGLDAAEGEFVYILNGDNTIRPKFIEKMYNPEAHILVCGVQMNDMPGITLNGNSFDRGRFDRANYAMLAEPAKRIGYKDFSMQQDDYWWFMACYEYMSKRGHVIIHHTDEVLAEHN